MTAALAQDIVNRRLTIARREPVAKTPFRRRCAAVAAVTAMPAKRTKVATICEPPDITGPPLPRPDSPEADAELAAFAKALAHPTRVRILRLLARKEARMCSHIVDELPLAQSTVSEHLRILRAAGLVRANESGPCVGYCIVPPMVRRLKHLLEFL